MKAIVDMGEARIAGQRVAGEPLAWLQRLAHRRLRRSIGVGEEPTAPCDDPELAYFAPGSVVRQVHADLPSMLIGGLASLMLQTLHPLVMAGVAQHSRYRDDPLGRLERTARFVGTTTFASRPDALAAIETVRRRHGSVTGSFEGVSYAAQDPELLEWVHAAEVYSFLEASDRFGARRLDAQERDAYVEAMAQVALDLGATEVPRSTRELDAYLDQIRSQLRLTDEARQARNFILRGVGRWPHELATYGLLVTAAQGVLPAWARRELRLLAIPAGDALLVRPAASALCSMLRFVAPGPARACRTASSPAS
jgi:uncharacterized protein (DUF2236 family)